jgi:uncharacterized protein with von Willebrand factor type A (vWA) domain
MWHIENEQNEKLAIVYDELPLTKTSIRIRVVYNPKEKNAFDNAYRTFWKNYERLEANQKIERILDL